MERSIMDAEQNKCCLMCFKHEKLFVQNNMQMVNRLKVIFGTRNFDDTLNYGRFCVSCAGRVCQLYNFFIIAFHVSNNTTTDDFKQCFTCQRDTVIIEKDMTSEVEDFISSSRLFMTKAELPESLYCCYGCYNFMNAYNDLNEKLIIFEALKSTLVSLC